MTENLEPLGSASALKYSDGIAASRTLTAHEANASALQHRLPSKPNLPLYVAKNVNIVRWYQEDQVIDIARSDPIVTSTCRKQLLVPMLT